MRHLNPDVLDLRPVPEPKLTKLPPEGKEVAFSDLVKRSGMRQVTSENKKVRILITNLPHDTKTPNPGSVTFGLSGLGWDIESKDFAKEAIRRLAYGFHDWAARETAARYHRDLNRKDSFSPSNKETVQIGSAVDRILDVIIKEQGCTVGRISRVTGITQSNVSRGISLLEKRGVIFLERKGRAVHCSVI